MNSEKISAERKRAKIENFSKIWRVIAIYIITYIYIVFLFTIPQNIEKASAHNVNCNASGCNQSVWISLDAGFWSWVNTQCSNIFSDPIFRNMIVCLLQKFTHDDPDNNAHCRCAESPYDCTLSEAYNPKNLAPSGGINVPIPGRGNITLTDIRVWSWTLNSISCSISVVDSASTTCGNNDYYPSFDELRLSGTLNLTMTIRIIANQTAVGGGASDTYWAQVQVSVAPFEASIALFIRHLENFLTPSLASCVGSTLQDAGLSLIRLYIGNPAALTFRWIPPFPAVDTLRRLVSFLDAQLRYLALNQSIAAAVRPYLGPASVFDLSDFLGTDTILNPATTRSCRKGGRIGHPLGGNVWYDLGLETAWAAQAGGILMRGAIDIDLDYDDVPSVGDPGTLGCACPAVSGGASCATHPCAGNICAAISCTFFQRFWCLLLNERVLNIEDPPGSGVPVSRNTAGMFGGLMKSFGSCENWLMLLPQLKSYCPQGSNYAMGIRVVPTSCGSAQCGVNMQRPDSGTLVPYPVDLRFYAPLDIEIWFMENGTTWRRLFSFLTDLNFGINLAWWFCGGPPCQTWARVFYLGAVIDPDITAVQQDPTLPGYPPGGWNQSIADILGVLLSGNLFAGLYVGIGLKPIIDPDDLLANPANLDPIPAATYTPGSFAEPNLDSSVDVVNVGGHTFLRFYWNISGQLTARWLTNEIDKNMKIAPPIKTSKLKVETMRISQEKAEFLLIPEDDGEFSYIWRIDGGVWRGPEQTNKITLGPFLEGYHTVEFAAIDLKRNKITPPVSITFKIDSLPPDIITNIQDIMPERFVLYVQAKDFLTPDDEIEIQYSLNDDGFSDWTKEKAIPIKAKIGENVIRIRVKDKEGNISFYEKKFYTYRVGNFGCGVR